MSLVGDLVSDLFQGIGLPVRKIQQVCALTLAGMMVAFPVTFRHGITEWSKTEARHEMAVFEKAMGPMWKPAFSVPSPAHAAPVSTPAVPAPHPSRSPRSSEMTELRLHEWRAQATSTATGNTSCDSSRTSATP